MKYNNRFTVGLGSLIVIFFLCVSSFPIFAQRGPGGVSHELAGDSDCKMWLDASTLNLPDGSLVASWPDVSLSLNNNTPTQTNTSDQPIFRSAPSAGINGNPVIQFDPDNFLRLVSSDDINNNGPYSERTTFLAFRTGNDVTTRQMLWEQGGTVRGLNIYIFNGELYFGGYDIAVDGADGTPSWNYTFTKVPIQPNRVYIVSHIFDGPVGNTSGTISGFLNGEAFQTLDPVNGVPAPNVGSLFTHPNPPGIGAINGDSYNELGPLNNDTGDQAFLGDLAEIVSYQTLLNDAERIIVENYLAAKYGIDLAVNDEYAHQVMYGNDVIGIGRNIGATNNHNISQGRNLFEIEATTAEFANADLEYFLVGHNDADYSTWLSAGAPNNAINTFRIGREWKVDHTGNVGDVKISLDVSQLPAALAGYTKYCLVIDKSGGAIADFNSTATEVIEMSNVSGSIYEYTEPIPDNAYITFATIIPTVGFENTTAFGFEGTPVGNDNTVSVNVELNHRPLADVTVDYNYSNSTALFGAAAPFDYSNFNPGSFIVTIPANTTIGTIGFDILGDSNPESTEVFSLSLQVGANTTSGLAVNGLNAVLAYSIFDDDNTPKIGFGPITSSFDEGSGTVNVTVVRSGDPVPAVSVDYQLEAVGSGTATDLIDYTFTSGTLNFPSGVTSLTFPVTILEDGIDEPNETIVFELVNPVSADVLAAEKDHTLTITDNDLPPTVQFTSTNLSGIEAIGTPSIEVSLSSPSGFVVQVNYSDLLTGTATSIADYSISATGTLTFPIGTTTINLPIFINADGVLEPDETIDFELVAGSESNCTISGNTNHTYTIIDYSVFEWLGIAGVGLAQDNVFWLDADDLADADGADVTTFVDRSPNARTITQGTAANQPNMNFAGPNAKKELVFNGTTDVLEIVSGATINTAGPFSRKDIVVTFSTSADVTSRQIIYEQGGGTRGLNIYLQNGELFYHIWNNSNDNGANSAWGVGSPGGATFVSTGAGGITANTDYIAVFSYQVAGVSGLLEGFLNGQSVGSLTITNPAGVPPLLYNHGDPGGLGGRIGATRYINGQNANGYFQGAIQEVVHYNNGALNTARRNIVENHLSGKYAIPLTGNQIFPLAYSTTYENEIAGIGQLSAAENHSDARGTGMVRINNASSLEDGEYLMWGHDNGLESFNTPPVPEVIPDIDERLYRVWRTVETTGDVGTVTMIFDLSNVPGFGTYTEAELVLLIDKDDADFSNAVQIETGRTYNSGSGELIFTGIDLLNAEWFTIGRKIIDPLPVELVEFTATKRTEDVVLDWSTASEINSDVFIVERSKDGEVFEELSEVSAAGNSTELLNYQSIDRSPLNGLSYYRLKQRDNDGTLSYSNMQSVMWGDNLDLLAVPNPASDIVSIRLSTATNGEMIVRDAKGSLIQSISLNADKEVVLRVDTLQAGVYTIEVITSQEAVVERLVITK